MSETEEYEIERGLLVSFEDQHPRYTYGFEAGMIWQQMQGGADSFEQYVRAENRLTLERMCDAENFGFDFGDGEVEGWIIFTAWRRPKEPKKFRLIEGGIKPAT